MPTPPCLPAAVGSRAATHPASQPRRRPGEQNGPAGCTERRATRTGLVERRRRPRPSRWLAGRLPPLQLRAAPPASCGGTRQWSAPVWQPGQVTCAGVASARPGTGYKRDGLIEHRCFLAPLMSESLEAGPTEPGASRFCVCVGLAQWSSFCRLAVVRVGGQRDRVGPGPCPVAGPPDAGGRPAARAGRPSPEYTSDDRPRPRPRPRPRRPGRGRRK